MKLHLPKMLAVALLSACAAISANADVPYTGTVYTWDNTTSGSDPAFGNYAKTTYDEQGNPTVTSTVISGRSGNWGNVQAIFASDAIQTGNTLRFDSEHGQSVKSLNYTFSPFTVGGIIVEEGATGFSINSGGNNNRAFFLGNKNGSASYNEIHEDFAINKTTGGLTLTLRGAETFYVAEGKTFTLKSNNPIAMSGSMNVTGEGTVDIAQGNVTMGNGFSLTVQEGATLKFAGAVSGLSTTINNNGAITFNGVALSDSLAGFEVSGSYVDYSGAPSANGNGYAGALDYTIIKGNTDALTQVTWKGETKTLNEGVMHVEADVDYTTYHLNTDGTSLDLAAEKTNNDRLNAVTLATGTKLVANDNFNGTVSGTGTATVEIAADKVLTGALTGVALTGAGTYELASGTGAVGTGVTFASGWTGTVKLSNITTTELDLNNFGITGSVVEIDNWSRYLKNSNGYVYNPKLRLSGAGMTVADGYSNYSYVFAGGVEGEGDFKIGITTSANNQTYVFTGDVSDWTGAYESLKNKNTTIQFSGLALEMGAAIKQTDGTINIVVGDGETEFSTVFDKAVTASTLTINDKATATFKNETSIDTLAGAGSLVVNAADHTVALSGGSVAHPIDLQAGTLSLSGAYTLDALEVQDYKAEYVRPESGIAEGSGFLKATGNLEVVAIQGGTLSIAEDATFSYNNSAVIMDQSTGKAALSGEVNLTTLWVNGSGDVSYDAAQAYAEQQVPETVVGTVHLNADGATVNMDRAGASVALVLSETAVNATVNATAATTISSITGWADTLTVSGTEAVTMPAGTMTLTGSQKLVVEGIVDANKIQLDSDDAVLTVADGATLNITGNNNLTPNKGTVNISGTVNVGHELDLSNGSKATGEVNIATGGKLSVWGMWMHNGVSVNLEEDGEFAIGRNEVKDLSIIGKDGGSITFTPATGDATYGTQNANFKITNATVTTTGANVTLGNTLENVDLVIADGSSTLLNTTADSVTVNEGGTLLINKEMDLGSTLTSNGNITVATAGVVTISGDSTFVNVITNSGTVHLNGITLDTEYFQQQGGDTDAHFNLNDELTTDDNYFVGTSEAFVQVVSGGTSDTTGITWDGETYNTLTNGKIVTGEAVVDHTTFYVGGEISTSTINGSEHVSDIANINVGDGATLTVDAVSEAAIHAQDGATVAGNQAQQSVEIAADATVTYAYGISSTEGVYVFGLDGVSVTNNSGSDAIYGGLDDANMAVEADALSSNVNDEYIVNNQLSVSTVTHGGEGELTLAHVSGDALSVVETDTAALILQGITATTLSELTIGGGATVGVYTDTTKATEGTVTIDAAGVLTAGGSTLRANLVMENDSALLTGGVQKALHVGSLLTMGSNISLDKATLQALDGLAVGDYFWLINAAEDSELLYGGSTGEDTWFDEVFSRTAHEGDYELKGDFNIVFDDVNGFGLQKFSSVPEPMTGTLSLLALMALAARRRRH